MQVHVQLHELRQYDIHVQTWRTVKSRHSAGLNVCSLAKPYVQHGREVLLCTMAVQCCCAVYILTVVRFDVFLLFSQCSALF